MKRRFRKFIDDRFALTTLQNPAIELRSHAELVAAAERGRQILQQAAAPPANPPPVAAAPPIIEVIPPPASIAPPESQDSLTANAALSPETQPAQPDTQSPKQKRRRKKESLAQCLERRRRESAAKIAAAIDSFLAGKIARDAAPAPEIETETEPEIQQHVEEDD
ncbi:MAG: hypothetical protein ABSC10_13385 [Candidatus Acidiferrales bacterium]|jgi:hypothetical protein